jgi:hypothetical protein
MGDRPVSLQELTARASKFATDWADATDEFRDTTQFWTEFFAMFGVSARRSGTFQAPATRSSTGNTGFMDYFWPSKIAVEQKSAGKDLNVAFEQLNDYLTGGDIPDHNLPQLAVACDFQHWIVRNLDTGEEHRFTLSELSDHIALFGFLGGYTKLRFGTDEAEANAAAAELLGRIHDELVEANYTGNDLDVLLVRILFLLFADDTSVWDDGPGLFAAWIDARTNEDGSDLGDHLLKWFDMLRRPQDKRPPNLPPDLAAVPYVNGGLFADDIEMPYCNADIRARLLEACRFEWSTISPAVFGAMFQTVMDPEARREIGAHYTTAENIHRLIDPMFLNELREELEACGNGKSLESRDKLKTLHAKLANMHFLDPACGCGNFLIITYRELRRIEQAILERLHLTEDQVLDINQFRKVSLNQFHGIEIKPFPATIAQTAMWLAEHKANVELGEAIGHYVKSFPLEDRANIRCDNALTLAWTDLLPADDCSIVFGNPPFVGRQFRTAEQKADLAHAWQDLRGHGVLDYVTGWWVLAAKYIHRTGGRVAFVSTNSVVQGEQVALLWDMLCSLGHSIDFAHRPFVWSSDARGEAKVSVVVVGFSDEDCDTTKRLFDYPDPKGAPLEIAAHVIGPYLTADCPIVVRKARKPIVDSMPVPEYGSMSNDNGHLLVTPDQMAQIERDPIARKFVRPIVGADEMLSGKRRWCLWLVDASPEELTSSPVIRERLKLVREYRSSSNRKATSDAADTPSLFVEMRPQKHRYLAVPFVSSERRRFIPMAFFEPETIIIAPHWCVPNCDNFTFGLLQSSAFTSWVAAIGGRHESRFRMSPGTVYNTFPFPAASGEQQSSVESAADRVLEVRNAHSDTALGVMYDRDAMPANLVTAHRALDEAVDRVLELPPKPTPELRLRVLLDRYQELTNR